MLEALSLALTEQTCARARNVAGMIIRDGASKAANLIRQVITKSRE
jgi:hypothetical protein